MRDKFPGKTIEYIRLDDDQNEYFTDSLSATLISENRVATTRAASENFSIVRRRVVGNVGEMVRMWVRRCDGGQLTASRAHTLHLFIRGALMSVRKMTAPKEVHPSRRVP